MNIRIKKTIAIGLILVITHAVFYMFGSIVSRKQILNSLEVDFNKSNASVNLGRYVEYRDIALAIKAEKLDRAICISELGASSMYDDLKSCLANQNCSVALKGKIHEAAPEILDEAPLKFNYIKRGDKMRLCAE